ncbi:iron-sulfur cluster biosynthesis family protein [Agromyces sp. Marseille-P2726]|uniref:iron-sulfur cluster biosynthesis family protein n=1 Tax=Agromyces sp. Marseille-P2726 TaxID=2709132 RepID=UPI00156F24E3|nr:iron-sulfur cluster biosynthesis family protein [Agromyces sp. Marseille-P2726]
MLTLTDTAAVVVKELVSRRHGPEASGLRIDTNDDAGREFAVAIVPTPDERDAVIEQDGARVYLGERAAVTLDDKTLDAAVSNDGRVSFDLLPQQA